MFTEIIIGVITTVLITIITGCLVKLKNKMNKTIDDTVAVKQGVQALLRAQLISEYNHYMEQGYAPIYARENFENVWKNYHQLGANGVMDDLKEKFNTLPTSPKEHKGD